MILSFLVEYHLLQGGGSFIELIRTLTLQKSEMKIRQLKYTIFPTVYFLEFEGSETTL